MLAFGMKKAPDKLPFEKQLKKLAEGYHAFIDDLAGWRERMRSANFADKSGAECRDEMLSYYKLAMQAAELFRKPGFLMPLAAFVTSIGVTNVVSAFTESTLHRAGFFDQTGIDLAGAGFQVRPSVRRSVGRSVGRSVC